MWYIQRTNIDISEEPRLIEALKKLNIKYKYFGIMENTITNIDNLNYLFKPIFRGSTKLIELLYKNGLNYLDYNEKYFDMKYYSRIKNLKKHLLNKGEFFKVKDLLYYTFEKDMFIKPTKDSKAFNGGIIHAGETLNNYLMRTPHRDIKSIEDEYCIISKIQDIKSEYRFFMYKNKIITSCRYMLNGKVNTSKDVPKIVIDKAVQYGCLYNPSDFYVIDLCVLDNKEDNIKIVEYNCWNCSGFYECDIEKIVEEVEHQRIKI